MDRRRFLSYSLLGSATLAATGISGARTSRAARAGSDEYGPSGISVRAAADTDLIFLSGAAALDLYHRHPHVPQDEILPDDIAAQTHMTLRNIFEVLRVAGLGWENVANVLRYQTNIADSPAIEAILAQHFGRWRPAMSAVQIDRLSAPASQLELEMIAVAPRAARSPGGDTSGREAGMPELDVIHTRPALADTMIFAPAIRVDEGRDIVFVSGLTARPIDRGSAVGRGFEMPGDFDGQARLATENIDRILAELGRAKSDIVRVVTFYTEGFNGRILGEYLQGWRPCSSAIGVRALPVPGAKVMYDLIVAG